MHRDEFSWAASGDVGVSEYDDVLVLIGCVQETSERRTWYMLCLGSGVHDVSALAKSKKVLRWRLNAIKQFVRRDWSQAGVIWCT
jgi:hypothetical protein